MPQTTPVTPSLTHVLVPSVYEFEARINWYALWIDVYPSTEIEFRLLALRRPPLLYRMFTV